MPAFTPPGLGWHRDLPDWRDYSWEHETIAARLNGLRGRGNGERSLPAAEDWSEYFPSITNQGSLQASTAHAVVGLVAYYERRAHARRFEGSALFLYKTSRLLLEWPGDSGATLRETLKALARFGLPPAKFWSPEPDNYDVTPAPHAYCYAREYEPMIYFRLDTAESDRCELLTTIRRFLASGFPVVFGFSVFDSLDLDPEIPFPAVPDRAVGGQSMVAVGYDDRLGTRCGRGAIRVRSSWGGDWGENGYGWLPYGYLREGLAADFWTILRPDWLEYGDFEIFP